MTPNKAGASSIMLSSGPIQLPISYLPQQTFRIPSPLGSSAEATAMLARQQLKKPPGFLQELQLSPRRPHPRAGLPMLESVEGVQSPRTWLPTSPRGRVHVRSLVLDEPAGPPAEPAVQTKGTLRFQSERSPRLTGSIFYYKDNTYAVKWDNRSLNADAFIHLDIDSNGIATHFKMEAISPLTDFSFDFQDLDFAKDLE